MARQSVIRYRAGYKYQLAETYHVATGLSPDRHLITEFIELTPAGELTILRGYAWDGPSGPTFDTKNFMRGSLVHDALYQLLREGLLTGPESRKLADMELRRLCRADGMSAARAWWVYRALRRAGGAAASPKNKKEIHTAP